MSKKPKVMLENTIGGRIDKIISRYCNNITDFAVSLNYDQSTLTKVRLGLKPLSKKLSNLISLKYHVNEDWLLTGEGEMFDGPRDVIAEEIPAYHGLDPKLQQLINELMIVYNEGDAKQRSEVIGVIGAQYVEITKAKETARHGQDSSFPEKKSGEQKSA